VPLHQLEAYIGKTVQLLQTPVIVQIIPSCAKAKFYPALISAYAYQAHCYHLPEPAIMLVEGDLVPAVGYGYDDYDYSTYPPHNRSAYFMWKFDKLDRTLQLEMTSDTFEELILKRGLSGTKQPISYASRAQISHRGGKLAE
jgi:hypothetical protein